MSIHVVFSPLGKPLFMDTSLHDIAYVVILSSSESGASWAIATYGASEKEAADHAQGYAGYNYHMKIVETIPLCPAHPEELMNNELVWHELSRRYPYLMGSWRSDPISPLCSDCLQRLYTEYEKGLSV